MHAYLIVGGNLKTRGEKLEEILSPKGIGEAAGDRFNLGSGAADSLKIEDVRETERWIGLKRKNLTAVIVNEADRLTLPAQHAFLKTLEEPGDNILIVLTAGDDRSLLPTVRSRCKIIRLPCLAGRRATSDIRLLTAEKYQILLSGTVAEKLVRLYPIVKQTTGSGATLNRGTIKRDEGIKFLEQTVTSLRASESERGNLVELGTTLEAAAIAHQRLKNNLNPTLVLHQFVMDISAEDW